MIGVLALAILLFGLCGLLHVAAMRFAFRFVSERSFGVSARTLLGLYIAGAAHLSEAGLYAIGFLFGQRVGLGGFEGAPGETDWMDALYFSVVNYTSLGLGDIYPTGHLRFLAGVESLNGFLLISCSAALLFGLMRVESHERR